MQANCLGASSKFSSAISLVRVAKNFFYIDFWLENGNKTYRILISHDSNFTFSGFSSIGIYWKNMIKLDQILTYQDFNTLISILVDYRKTPFFTDLFWWE